MIWMCIAICLYVIGFIFTFRAIDLGGGIAFWAALFWPIIMILGELNELK